MIRRNNSLIPLTSVNTFQTSNETCGKFWTQNFPISSLPKGLCYKYLLGKGIRRKPFDEM